MVYFKAIDDGAGRFEGPDSPAQRQGALQIGEIWAAVYRSRIVLATIMAVVLSLAVALSLLITPTYQATATVEIKQEAQKVLGTEDEREQAGSPLDVQRFLQTQLDIIGSRSTTAAVAQTLRLFDSSRFLEAMNVDTEVKGSAFRNAEEARRELVIDTLLDNLNVSFSNETRIAQIKFESSDPRLAAEVANSYAENYIRLNLSRRFDASKYSLEFLRGQIAEAQARLGQTEQRAVNYARRYRIINTGTGVDGPQGSASVPRSITTASLAQLNQALSDAVSRRVEAEQKWQQVSGASLLSIPEVLSNPAVQQLVQERATLRAQNSEQLERRTQENPIVRQTAARLAELDQQINSVASNLRSSIRGQFVAAQAQENALRRRVEGLMSASLDEQDRTIQLSILQRQAQTNREQLDSLLKRYNELNAQSGVQLNNVSVIDRAEIPEKPVWPKVLLNLAGAFLLGIFLSALYVFLRENIFQAIRTPDDVSERLHLPLLGSLPQSQDVISDLVDNKSAVSEAFSTIRTSLALSSSSGVPKRLVFTSSQASEGKTTTCYGLGLSLSKIGRKVVLVDCDLRRPNLHRTLGVENERGVSNILSGGIAIGDALIRDQKMGLDILLAGPPPPNPAELLASGQLAALVDGLAGMYDHVLIDSPPLLGLADAPIIASTTDGVIYVIESGRTSVRGVTFALNRLNSSGATIIGVVLSRFNPDRMGYGYEYSYRQQYSYAAE